MAANTTPIFIKQGNFTPARVDAQNTAFNGTGTTYDLVIGQTDGTRVDGVRFTNVGTAGTINAKVMRVFICDNVVANTNCRLIGEVAFASTTTTNVAARQTGALTFDQPIILKSTQKLIVTASATTFTVGTDTTDAVAYAGDY